MKKIGVFYGSTSGNTTAIVDEVEFYLRKEEYEVINVADGIKGIENYENLILITPTYGVGELQADWEAVSSDLRKIDFSNKRVGIIGLGNQFAFGESFVGGMRVLYDIVTQNNGIVVGMTKDEGYKYEETNAVIDGNFVGLAIDESNQGSQTPEKIEAWIEEIKKYFI